VINYTKVTGDNSLNLSLEPDEYGEQEGSLEVKLPGEDNDGNDTEFTVFTGTASALHSRGSGKTNNIQLPFFRKLNLIPRLNRKLI